MEVSMTAFDDELAKRAQRARDVALFRYALVRQAADPGLSKRDRGELVRQLASVEHAGPSGTPVRVSRPTLDRWVRAWQVGGVDALGPSPREGPARVGAAALGAAAPPQPVDPPPGAGP